MSAQQRGFGGDGGIPMNPMNMLNGLGNMLGQMPGLPPGAANLLSAASEMMSAKQGLQKAIVGIPVAAVPIPKTYRVYAHPDGVIIKCARDLDLQEQLEYFAIEYVEFVFAQVISKGQVEVSPVCVNGYRVLLDCVKFDPEMKAFVYQYSYRKYVVEHGEVQELPIKKINVPVIDVEDKDSEAYVTKLFNIVPYTSNTSGSQSIVASTAQTGIGYSGSGSTAQTEIPQLSTPTSTAQPIKTSAPVKQRKEISRSEIFNRIKDVPYSVGLKKHILIYQIVEEEIDTKTLFYRYIYNSTFEGEDKLLQEDRHLEYESKSPMLSQKLPPIFKSLAKQQDADAMAEADWAEAATLLELCDI